VTDAELASVQVIGHYFHHMLPDVMAGVDHLIDLSLVDPVNV
jgi:dipeptidyl aminopeptidase/acylaminoacyl peptidase